jgi:acyl-CoA reductase-like NAD-dependent aldehyde dehydrogenase
MTEIEVLDPATVRPIAAVEDMDETTVDAAVRRARAAFDNGGWWPGTPDEERGRVLARAAELVRAQADRLARLESLDVGKPIAEAQGDVDEAARILEYYAGWPTKAAGDSYPDLGRALRAARVIRAGVVWINDSQIAPVQAPWGGFKQSGIGRELGPRGLEDYVEAKHIYLNHA